MVQVNENIIIPDSELEWTFVRSSGKGGQNVNKVNSKAVLRFNLLESPSIPEEARDRARIRYANMFNEWGEIIITSDRHRNQPQNIQDCLDKLINMIRSVATRPKVRKKTKPSRSAKRKRLDNKKSQSLKKQLRKKDW